LKAGDQFVLKGDIHRFGRRQLRLQVLPVTAGDHGCGLCADGEPGLCALSRVDPHPVQLLRMRGDAQHRMREAAWGMGEHSRRDCGCQTCTPSKAVGVGTVQRISRELACGA
jgi:hypothetical protein